MRVWAHYVDIFGAQGHSKVGLDPMSLTCSGYQPKHRTACQLPTPARHLVPHPASIQSTLCVKSTILWASCCRRAGQHPPNLQKIYPAQAKRVRKAPQRYCGGQDVPPLHNSHSEEQRPAQLHSHSGSHVCASAPDEAVEK